MTKKFKLKDLDCANCAAKMESGIQKLPGVQDASVNFMMQKLSIKAEDDTSFEELMPQVVKLCKKIEPDCQICL